MAKMPTPAPPTHRVRSKSAPRGRSPDPKALKKAAARAKTAKKGGAKEDPNFVTPPPKARNHSPGEASGSKAPRRRISFGENSVHPIAAENPPPAKEMEVKEADKIIGKILAANAEDP